MLLAAPEKVDWESYYSSLLASIPRQQSINPALPSPLLLSFGTSICLPVHILWQNRGRNSVTHFLSLSFLPPTNSFLTQWAGVRDTTWCIPAWLVAQQAIEQEISLSFRKGWGELNSDPEWREKEDLSPSLDNAAFSETLISLVQWAWFSSYQQLHNHRHLHPTVIFPRWALISTMDQFDISHYLYFTWGFLFYFSRGLIFVFVKRRTRELRGQ